METIKVKAKDVVHKPNIEEEFQMITASLLEQILTLKETVEQLKKELEEIKKWQSNKLSQDHIL